MAQTKKSPQKRTAKKSTPPVPYQPSQLTRLGTSFARRPHWYVFGLCIAYLVLLQTRFVLSGDIWAEAFGEYVEGAQYHQWQSFFQIGIAGYYNFLPKLVSYPFVIIGGPMQYIDHYFRLIVILLTVAITSFIAHPYNRGVIRNGVLRSLLAFMTLLTFYHVSTFNLINVWYVAFIPIILVSLSPHKFKNEWQQIAYAIFAMAACLSKPSLILLPLVLYRTVRHKEYLLGFIMSFAIGLESLLFLSSAYYAQFKPVHMDLFDRLTNSFLAPGLLLLKTFELTPPRLLAVFAASSFVGVCAFAVWRSRGFWQTAALGGVFALAIYSYVFAPDAAPLRIMSNFREVYADPMKLQREILVSFFVLLFLVLAADFLAQRYDEKRIMQMEITPLLVAGVTILAVLQYRPIDAQSAAVSTNMDPFRHSLQHKVSTCMPIPPTPDWMPPGYRGTASGWFYQSYGRCTPTNYNTIIDHQSFTRQLGAGVAIVVPANRNNQIKALMVAIANPNPDQTRVLHLTNTTTKTRYEATLPAKTNSKTLSFVTFNLAGEPVVDKAYHYQLSETDQPNSSLTTGIFKYDGRMVHYAYTMPYPNLDDYKHREERRHN